MILDGTHVREPIRFKSLLAALCVAAVRIHPVLWYPRWSIGTPWENQLLEDTCIAEDSSQPNSMESTFTQIMSQTCYGAHDRQLMVRGRM